MLVSVRPGDVHVLPIPGDNGETKERFCIILDSYPTPSGAEVVCFVFGCSETKRKACSGEFVRIEREPASRFRALGLLNATTFHQEDIRHYDARSSRFQRRRCGVCGPSLMLELRKLAEARARQSAPIQLLPDRAREDAKLSAKAWRAEQAEETSQDPSARPLQTNLKLIANEVEMSSTSAAEEVDSSAGRYEINEPLASKEEPEG